MTEMFGEAWSPMSVPDLAPDDDDDVTERSVLNVHWGFALPALSLVLKEGKSPNVLF